MCSHGFIYLRRLTQPLNHGPVVRRTGAMLPQLQISADRMQLSGIYNAIPYEYRQKDTET